MPPTATLVKPAELRSQLEGLGEKINDLRGKDRTDEVRSELRDAIDQVSELDTLLRIHQRSAEIESERLAAEAAANGPKGGTRQAGDAEWRSIGQQFVEGEGYDAFASQQRSSGSFEVEVRTLLDSTGTWAATHTDGVGLLRPTGQPMLPPQTVVRQRLFLRDLLSVVQTGLASVPYIKELNAAAYASSASGAQFVAEGGDKPEVGLSFTTDDAPIRKIAAWMPATYEILQDAPTLRGYIDQRLRYMLALAEERALLNGSGTAPSIRGILQQSSIQTQAYSTDAFVSLGLGMGKLEVVDGEPTFIAMHPTDYWTMATTRYSSHFEGSQGVSSLNSPFGNPFAQIWGVPVVRTVGITAGNALVGCRNGAVILDREQTVIRVGDQHLGYFTSNKVAILGEERIGLAVHRPDWFVNVDISA